MTSTVVGGGSLSGPVKLRDATEVMLRSPHHLQFGTVPGHALVLGVPDGVSASQVMLVLREAMRPVDLGELATRLGHCGFTPEHAAGILGDLESSGLLRRLPRPDATVHVTGTSALTGALLKELLRCGVAAATVTPGAPAFTRLTPDNLVVLAGQLFPPQDVTHRLMAQGVPHLPFGVIDGQVVIGPLVRPGDSPCLGCIDAQLITADPEWRLIRAQSVGGAGGNPSSGTTLTSMASATVAGMVRASLGAESPPQDAEPSGLEVRRFLDPVTLAVETVRPQAFPGCPGCAVVGTHRSDRPTAGPVSGSCG